MFYLQITLKINTENRAAAAGVYQQYKTEFLSSIVGAQSKELLVREVDVQVLHGFSTEEAASNYLKSALFTKDVVGALSPLLADVPDIRIYQVV